MGENLQNNGIDVEYTRTTDVYETPYEKAMEANEAGVDLFISIHRNSFPSDNTAFGVESLVYDLSGLKYEIAESVNQQLEAVGFRNLGVKARPNLVVLKRTKMPAVLIEVGFINSDVDNRLFDENFNDIALAISDGILDVLRDNSLISESETDPGSDTEHAPDMKSRNIGYRQAHFATVCTQSVCWVNYWSRIIRRILMIPAHMRECRWDDIQI